MCGRYQLTDDRDIEEINRIIIEVNNKLNGTGAKAKTGEIYPTDSVPVISYQDNKRSLNIMKWGFPKWDGKGVIINAKSETANEKKMFAKPLIEKRCVIPSTGFFEWKQKDDSKGKDKYLFTLEDSPVLYMAGIYQIFKSGEQNMEHFVILTRHANRYMSEIHDRMPVILDPNNIESWLADESYILFAFHRDDMVLKRSII